MKNIIFLTLIVSFLSCEAPSIDHHKVSMEKITRIIESQQINNEAFGGMADVEFSQEGLELWIKKHAKAMYIARQNYLVTKIDLNELVKDTNLLKANVVSDSIYNEMIYIEIKKLSEKSIPSAGQPDDKSYRIFKKGTIQIQKLNEECHSIIMAKNELLRKVLKE